jgi:hypothetical protein
VGLARPVFGESSIITNSSILTGLGRLLQIHKARDSAHGTGSRLVEIREFVDNLVPLDDSPDTFLTRHGTMQRSNLSVLPTSAQVYGTSPGGRVVMK